MWSGRRIAQRIPKNQQLCRQKTSTALGMGHATWNLPWLFGAFEKCCAANRMTPMSSGGGTSEVDHDLAAALLTSKNLPPEGFSAVDSGTTLTIT
mmetsp:Transcript_20338/g.40340  ORF Transcript_20338/g.40340 Transcript_20338/m.40340 type:complete len:95 (+) Transcript_20338:5-289(+)